MPAFFQDLDRFGAASAVSFYSASKSIQRISYSDLQNKCQVFAKQIKQSRSLVLLLTDNSCETLISYLTCLQNGHPVMLLDNSISELHLEEIKRRYQANYVISGSNVAHCSSTAHLLDPRLAVLLSTSGSTGSPKQVALSYDNLQSNAKSICQYLPIHPADTTLTTLPFNYSYGLSIINSHLLTGAGIFLSSLSIVDKDFWQLLDEAEITSFGGVPYSYEMLIRLGLTRKELSFLRYFTQAGGKLAGKKVKVLQTYAQQHCKKFYVMYGQTEATARMAYVKPETLSNKPDSIGKAIPDGKLTLLDEAGALIKQAHQQGELVYEGPNVMLGYARYLADLKEFDVEERLKTGDIAYFDEDGDFFITGRLKRFIKIFGLRISLDEVEHMLRHMGIDCYVVGEDNKLKIAVTTASLINKAKNKDSLIKDMTSQLGIHHSTIKILEVDTLPQNNNGKADYKATEKLFTS